MAKDFEKQMEPVIIKQSTKMIGSCPRCSTTRFQGVYEQGEFIDRVWTVKETVYTCLNCHHTCQASELVDRVVG